jgi:hypothetical protein
MMKRVTGPWHPPGTTPLEELTLVKQALDRGRPSVPAEAVIAGAVLIVLCIRDIVREHSTFSFAANGSLILGSVALAGWLVRRYRQSRLEWLRAVEAWNRYKQR